MHRRLSDQVFLGFVAVAVLPIAMIAAFERYGARRAALQDAQETLREDAAFSASYLGTHVGLHAAGVALLARGGSVLELGDAALTSARREFPGFETLVRTDASGRVVAQAWRPGTAGERDLHGVSLAAQPMFRQALASDTTVVSGMVGGYGMDGAPRVALAHRVLDGQGRLAGVIGGTLDPAQFGDVARLFVNGRAVLVADAQDHVLYSTPSLGFTPGRPWALHQADARRAGTMDDWVMADARTRQGWRVVVVRARAEILADHVWFRAAFPAALGVVLIVGLGLAAMLGRRIARPLADLTAWARSHSVTEEAAPPQPPAGAPLELAELVVHLQETTARAREAYRRVSDMMEQRDVLNRQLHDVLTGLDRTVEERTRELAEALRVAEEASLTKSRFLATMSHELRTPLNSVIGFAAILRKNRQGALQPRDIEMIGRIEANGRHLLSLINDILDLSKVEAGRMTLAQAPVDVAMMARGVLTDLSGQLAGRPVALRYEGPDALVMETDEDRMRQVLMNLVGNAVKFTPSGEVAVRVDADDTDGITIEVRDTGIGIPADRLQAIFKPFEQADEGTARRFGGTGLGLAISRSLAEMLGATISVESTPGAGSCFRLHFAAPDAVPVAAGGGGSRDGRFEVPSDL